MDSFAVVMLGLELLFFAGCGVILIYLIVRRIRIKKTEDLGERDN